MPRPRYRACLQDGLKLDINRLRRNGWLVPGASKGPSGIAWRNSYTDEVIASGLITADMAGERYGCLRIRIGRLEEQVISLRREPRHFGSGQWYFECPRSWRLCSTLWMPPGASSFACRQAWRRQVAYASQYQTWYDRALTQGQRLRAKLGGEEWAGYNGDDPPKPKWMRWRTYNRILDRSDRYEAIADKRLAHFAARLMPRR